MKTHSKYLVVIATLSAAAVLIISISRNSPKSDTNNIQNHFAAPQYACNDVISPENEYIKPRIKAADLWRLNPVDPTQREKYIAVDTGEPNHTAAALVVAHLDTRPALKSLVTVKQGDDIEISLPDGATARCHVNLVMDDHGALRFGGSLKGNHPGTFSLSISEDKQLAGRILIPSLSLAYIIEPDSNNGSAQMKAVAMEGVICTPASAMNTDAIDTNEPPKERQEAAPYLSSRPEAKAILYLCFDGATVVDPDWNGGNAISAAPANFTRDQIVDAWKRVSEDYSPFNVNITTDPTLYNNAPVGQRMRCIITPTKSWYGSSGGVAWLRSFARAGKTFSTTVPCWVFLTSAPAVAETISHELGHTLALSHDRSKEPAEEYYVGHGTAPLSWGPIMGGAYDQKIVQWSKGEFSGASNMEDDVTVIASVSNGFGFAPTGAGNSLNTAALLGVGPAFSANGVIVSATCINYYRFTLAEPATVSISANPNEISPNLDIDLQLLDASGVQIAHDNPSLALNAVIERTLQAGTYYITVKGAGYADPSINGYSNYGSLGRYTLNSTAIAPITPPVITKQPVAKSLSVRETTLTLTADGAGQGNLRFQWRKNGVDLISSPRIYTATSPTLTILNPQQTDSGAYTFVAINSGGEVSSNAATVEVVPITPPMITSFTPSGAAPGSTVIISGSFFADVTSVLFNGIAAASYTVNTATQITAIAPATLSGAGNITINTTGGTSVSTGQFFFAHVPSNLSPLPGTQVVTVGHNASFVASATAFPEAVYYWQSSTDNGVSWENLRDDAHHSGVETNTLHINTAPSEMNWRNYRYIADNGYGATASNMLILNIIDANMPVPVAMAIDTEKNLYIVDASIHSIHKIDNRALITPFAGQSGESGVVDASGTNARFNNPRGIAINKAGDFLVADTGNAIIRKISADGVVTTLAGRASVRGTQDGTGIEATFNTPESVCFTPNGSAYIADSSAHTVRFMSVEGDVTTSVGACGVTGAVSATGTNARLNTPTYVQTDHAGHLYIADTGNDAIRTVAADGTVLLYAGCAGTSGANDQFAPHARLSQPRGMTKDSANNIYFADTGNSVIRMITNDGEVITLAGSAGVAGMRDGVKQAALFDHPVDVEFDGNGNLYVVDTGNAAVRKIVLATGQVTTLAIGTTIAKPPAFPSKTTQNETSNSESGGGGGAVSPWCITALITLIAARYTRRN